MYADRDKEHKENLKKKEALIAEIDAFELSGNHGDDLAASRNSPTVGPRADTCPAAFSSRLSTATAPPWTPNTTPWEPSAANARSKHTSSRVESMVTGEGAEHMARKEERMMREKMDRLRKRVAQYENNMGIFTGKGAASIMADLQKKIESDKREMDEIRRKLKMLREARQAESSGLIRRSRGERRGARATVRELEPVVLLVQHVQHIELDAFRAIPPHRGPVKKTTGWDVQERINWRNSTPSMDGITESSRMRSSSCVVRMLTASRASQTWPPCGCLP